mgnify:FL=1
MVGDSEQYASAMALMARSLGLPSRVVLGFLPKDDEGEISESRTEEQGTTTITKFTGNDVTAWVEIKLDGYGWVAFYPTPKETKVPDENQNLTPPNPQTLVRQPPGTTHRPATRRHPGQRQVLNRRKHGRRNLSQPVLAAFRQNRKKSSHLRKPSMDAAHHMRSPARHQSDRTGTIKKTRQHAAACGSRLAIGRRARTAKRTRHSRHTQRTGGFDRESDGYFPRDLARFGRASRLRGLLR